MPDPVATPELTPRQKILNSAIAQANGLSDAVAVLRTLDPGLAQLLQGKTLAGSKSPWGVLASGLAGAAVSHYGLACGAAAQAAASCLTPDTVGLIQLGATLLGAMIGAYVMRLFTSAPITGILSTTPIPPAAPPAPVVVVGTPVAETPAAGTTAP